MKKVECVIMEWAGSAVDYGCFASVAPLVETFADICVHLRVKEIRRSMGINTIDHIRQLLDIERVSVPFQKHYHRTWSENDVAIMNNKLEGYLLEAMKYHATPIEGVVDTLSALREQGIKIGATTSFPQSLMEVLVSCAKEYDYFVDHSVGPDGLHGGRPQPYMIYKNMIELGIPSTRSVVKYANTLTGIQEGLNANVWTVGVVMGSSELGLTERAVADMPFIELECHKSQVRRNMLRAGAHYVVDSIEELPGVIERINLALNE